MAPRKKREKTGMERTLESIESRVDDARDDWIEKQDRWAFRYFNDMPIVIRALRKVMWNRGRKKEGAK